MDLSSPPPSPAIPINSGIDYQTYTQRSNTFHRRKSSLKILGFFIWSVTAFGLGLAIGNASPINLGNGQVGTTPLYELKRHIPGVIQRQADGCKISGCGGRLCLETDTLENIESDCVPDRYVCYQEAICERQATGQCGWTQTPAFQGCQAPFQDRTIDLHKNVFKKD